MTEQTTITIRPDTRQRLKAAKRGGETYDEQLNRFLDLAEAIDPQEAIRIVSEAALHGLLPE